MTIIAIGIDLAKSVFVVHGVDEFGKSALVCDNEHFMASKSRTYFSWGVRLMGPTLPAVSYSRDSCVLRVTKMRRGSNGGSLDPYTIYRNNRMKAA